MRCGFRLEGKRMTTLDFELEIGLGAAGNYPMVARAPSGEAAATLRWSATPAEHEHLLAVVKDKVLVERQRLQVALAGLAREGLVELAWVAGQTYGDLEDVLDSGPWHVFHFVGHGGYDQMADEGTLALADETGRTHSIGADDFSRLLAEHYPLRLVVLNACDTGRGSASDAFSSTAAALIRREIPAVVAMQFEITDEAAIRFAQSFYWHVAKRRPVDDSVRRARVALRLAKKDSLEWGTPVLYLRSPDGRIFDATIPPALTHQRCARRWGR